MDTWRAILAEKMDIVGDPGPVIAYAPNEAAFDVVFDSGHGLAEGPSVLAWTADRVYFPREVDGSESLGSAPRNPPSGEQSRDT